MWKLLHFILLAYSISAIHLEVLIVSRWKSRDRRDNLRALFTNCGNRDPTHQVGYTFFMADTKNLTVEEKSNYLEELVYHDDLVILPGHDSDPPVARDITYVLDRPTSRGYRLAHGTQWIVQHRQTVDYVLYLDDDAIVSVSRLLELIEQVQHPLLAMGFIMNTDLEHSQEDICELCGPAMCRRCMDDPDINEFCDYMRMFHPDLKLGGCLHYLNICKIFGVADDDNPKEGEDTFPLGNCALRVYKEENDLVQYFGNRQPPPWMLGMGWVWGRKIIDFVARNVDYLKLNGAADITTGYWMAPLEGVAFFNIRDDGYFHDYPEYGSQFSRRCTNNSILIHRMNQERWQHLNTDTCELHCINVTATGDWDPKANPYPEPFLDPDDDSSSSLSNSSEESEPYDLNESHAEIASRRRSTCSKASFLTSPDPYIRSAMECFQLTNPQQIKWAHAVNTCEKLEAALNDPEVHFLECDVGYGWYRRGSRTGVAFDSEASEEEPDGDSNPMDLIMAHFPTTYKTVFLYAEKKLSVARGRAPPGVNYGAGADAGIAAVCHNIRDPAIVGIANAANGLRNDDGEILLVGLHWLKFEDMGLTAPLDEGQVRVLGSNIVLDSHGNLYRDEVYEVFFCLTPSQLLTRGSMKFSACFEVSRVASSVLPWLLTDLFRALDSGEKRRWQIHVGVGLEDKRGFRSFTDDDAKRQKEQTPGRPRPSDPASKHQPANSKQKPRPASSRGSSFPPTTRTPSEQALAHLARANAISRKTSDLYFFEMVDAVRDHNQRAIKWAAEGLQPFALGSIQAAPKIKGLKIDIKHMHAVKSCLTYLEKIPEKEIPHLWINADILEGPAGINLVNPLDSEKFLTLCAKHSPHAVLSLGWTHGIPGAKTQYSRKMIDNMIREVMSPVIPVNPHDEDCEEKVPIAMKCRHLTFTVCSWYAQGSVDVLKDLLLTVPNSSLTIWTGVGEPPLSIDTKNKILKKFDKALAVEGSSCPPALFLDLRLQEENSACCLM
eukprot:gene993-531_t